MRAQTRVSQRTARRHGAGRKLFWTAVLAAGLFVAWSATDGYGQRRGLGHRGGQAPAWTERDIIKAVGYLDVDEDQRAPIATRLASLNDALESARADQRRLIEAAGKLLQADQLDAVQLAALRAEAEDVARRAAGDSMDALIDIASVLDAEQRRLLVSEWEAHR